MTAMPETKMKDSDAHPTRSARLTVLGLALAALVTLNAPARAEVLSLVCVWPRNPCCDEFYDVDLAAGTVTWGHAPRGSEGILGPVRAQITAYRITWHAYAGRWADFTIDRLRGTSFVCDNDSCSDPQTCQPADAVKPKF